MTDVIAFDLCVFDVEVLHFDMGPDVLTVGDRDISCVGVFVALGPFCATFAVAAIWHGFGMWSRAPPAGHRGVRIGLGYVRLVLWSELGCWHSGQCALRGGARP